MDVDPPGGSSSRWPESRSASEMLTADEQLARALQEEYDNELAELGNNLGLHSGHLPSPRLTPSPSDFGRTAVDGLEMYLDNSQEQPGPSHRDAADQRRLDWTKMALGAAASQMQGPALHEQVSAKLVSQFGAQPQQVSDEEYCRQLQRQQDEEYARSVQCGFQDEACKQHLRQVESFLEPAAADADHLHAWLEESCVQKALAVSLKDSGAGTSATSRSSLTESSFSVLDEPTSSNSMSIIDVESESMDVVEASPQPN